MKIVLLLAAALTLALGTARASEDPSSMKPADYNDFGIRLLRGIASGEGSENVFISPVSIGVALSMAAQGAAGSTRAVLLHALDVPESGLSERNAALIAELHQNADANAGIANAIWLREDLAPAPAYVETLHRSYGALAQAVRFGDPSAAGAINAWTKAHTLGLIDRIVDRTTSDDFLFLTNALAFEGKWAIPFKKSATHPAPFTQADGRERSVDMMTNTGGYDEFDGTGYRAVRLPYGKGGYAAYILLPSNRDTAPLLKTLNSQTFANIATSMQSKRLQLGVPRFTAKFETSLVPQLQALGAGGAFSAETADFSIMRPPPPRVFISSVRHAAYVRVDEAGTVAAAATSVGMTMTAIELPQTTFIVDHPFIFAIRDERTGGLLFIGAIRTIEAP